MEVRNRAAEMRNGRSESVSSCRCVVAVLPEASEAVGPEAFPVVDEPVDSAVHEPEALAHAAEERLRLEEVAADVRNRNS